MSTQGTRQGFFSSLQNLSVTVMAMLQTRMELLGNEVEIGAASFRGCAESSQRNGLRVPAVSESCR
jgi:hypothetical protein